MSSIIDEIAKAEAQAAAIRQDASVAARDAVAAVQAEVETLLAQQAEQGRAQLRAASQQAEEEGALVAQKVIAERQAQAQAECRQARDKLPQAVSYLRRRVVSME